MKRSECYKVPTSIPEERPLQQSSHISEDDEDHDLVDMTPSTTLSNIPVPSYRDSESDNVGRSETEVVSDTEANLLPPSEQAEDEIPQTIVPTVPSASEGHVVDAALGPKRVRQQPDRLCMNWTDKSYT